MGVLDINDRLKHRIRITDQDIEDSTWEGSDPPDELPTESSEPIRSPRQRRPKLRPKYFVNASSHRPKGSRSGRRYENSSTETPTQDLRNFPDLTFAEVESYAKTVTGCTSTTKAYKFFAEPGYLHNIQACFLLSLVDHEEIQELELSDIVNQTMTIFSSLFEDPHKMKIWNDYASLPEDQQYQYIHSQTEPCESTTCASVTEDNRADYNEKMYADAGKSYLNIDKKIRGTFQKKRFPLGGLEILEKDLVSCLSDMPDAAVISILPSSMDRMMVHAICQYLKLACQSHNCTGCRLMEIENHQSTFELPRLLLSQYLKKKVLS